MTAAMLVLEQVSRDNLDEKSGDQDENQRTASSSMIAAGAVTRKRYLHS